MGALATALPRGVDMMVSVPLTFSDIAAPHANRGWGWPVHFLCSLGGVSYSAYLLRNPFRYIPSRALDQPAEAPSRTPAAEPLQFFSPAYITPENRPTANPPAETTILAPRSSPVVGAEMNMSSTVLLYDALGFWPANRLLNERNRYMISTLAVPDQLY